MLRMGKVIFSNTRNMNDYYKSTNKLNPDDILKNCLTKDMNKYYNSNLPRDKWDNIWEKVRHSTVEFDKAIYIISWHF